MLNGRRIRKHDAEQERIATAWARIVSDLTKETDILVRYTAWKNDNYLQNFADDGELIDTEDMVNLNTEATLLYQGLAQNMTKLADIFAIPEDSFSDLNAVNATKLQTNNDAFISKYNIDIADWDSRYN